MACFYVENSLSRCECIFVPLGIYYEMLHNDNIRYAGRCKNHEANRPHWNASNTCATLSPCGVANTLEHTHTQKTTASTHIDNNMRTHTHIHNNSCKQPYGFFLLAREWPFRGNSLKWHFVFKAHAKKTRPRAHTQRRVANKMRATFTLTENAPLNLLSNLENKYCIEIYAILCVSEAKRFN